MFVFGQIMGFVAMLFSCISFQVHSQKRLLLFHTACCVSFCLHYFLIGAQSAFVMNLVAVFRNIAYYYRDKRVLSHPSVPYLFAAVTAVCGIVAWEGLFSILVIVGLVINTVCMSFRNPQNIRKSILITSPLVLIYDVFVISIGGIVFEAMAIVSAVIGLLRYRRELREGAPTRNA